MKAFIFYILIFSIAVCSSVYADEGSFSVCDISSYDIQSNSFHTKILLPCSGSAQSLILNIVNPETFILEKQYSLDGLIKDPHISCTGDSIFVALSELDGNSSTEEGILKENDYSSGNNLRSLFLDKSPRVMLINSDETFAYLAIGVRQRADPPPKIVKVSLSSFQIVSEIVFGEWTRDMEITPDGTKLYVQTRNLFPDLPAAHHRWGVGVFDTSDLSLINNIVLEESPAGLLEMSDDGSELYISSGYVGVSEETGASLYIVDTSTDQITETLHFTYNGAKCETWCPEYDSVNDRLYCMAQPDVDGVHPFTNLIVEVNLNDYSYSFFMMGDNPLGRIALAPVQNGMRLFAIEQDSPVVHWKDVSP